MIVASFSLDDYVTDYLNNNERPLLSQQNARYQRIRAASRSIERVNTYPQEQE